MFAIKKHYDANGNVTRLSNPRYGNSAFECRGYFYTTRRFTSPCKTIIPSSKNLNLTYDAWNCLVRVTAHDGTIIASYTYDGLNRRILKTTPTETRRYYYNRNWQCLLETADDQPSIHYTWGLRYLDDLVCRHVDHHPIYSLADPNWNVVALVDSTATPLERYTYTAFGTCQIHTPTFTPRPTTSYHWTRTFTSQLLDPETGLMLYRNRFYHPTLGRFLTRDPIGYAGMDENLYRYVKNRVIRARDRYGLWDEWDELHSYFEEPENPDLTLGPQRIEILIEIIGQSPVYDDFVMPEWIDLHQFPTPVHPFWVSLQFPPHLQPLQMAPCPLEMLSELES